MNPEAQLAQRRSAINKAHAVRKARAWLKQDLKEGRANLSDLLSNPPELIHTAKVYDLLIAAPKWGRVKALKLCKEAEVRPECPVGCLTERQRAVLCEGVR